MIKFLILGLFQSVFAANPAADSSYSYCRDITQIERLTDRTRDSLERIKADDLKVERILISKDRRMLYLISGETLVRAFPVALGFNPFGHKQFEGDGKTPEGIYRVEFKNPKSEYNKALKISYPNKSDIEFAKSQGRSPGGDIMIHGLPKDLQKRKWVNFIHPYNWTRGCVAVTDAQIEEVYALVKENTLVETCKLTPLEDEDLIEILLPSRL